MQTLTNISHGVFHSRLETLLFLVFSSIAIYPLLSNLFDHLIWQPPAAVVLVSAVEKPTQLAL